MLGLCAPFTPLVGDADRFAFANGLSQSHELGDAQEAFTTSLRIFLDAAHRVGENQCPLLSEGVHRPGAMNAIVVAGGFLANGARQRQV